AGGDQQLGGGLVDRFARHGRHYADRQHHGEYLDEDDLPSPDDLQVLPQVQLRERGWVFGKHRSIAHHQRRTTRSGSSAGRTLRVSTTIRAMPAIRRYGMLLWSVRITTES